MTPDAPAEAGGEPVVTVVIPCYNSLRWLEACLESVRAQTFTRWVAVVVNDCSTDGDPAEVIRALGDPRITLLAHEQNRGLAAARNTGLATARTPYVLPVDADDLLTPDFLRRLLEVLEGDATLDCAFADFQLFGAEERVWAMDVRTPAALVESQWLPGPGVLMRRALWERVGGYCEDATLRLGNEDWDFWIGAAEAGFRPGHVAEPLYRYRQHGANMSHGLRLHDHVTRAHMVARHPAFFRRFGAARSFVAEGLWRSAETARRAGRPLRSLGLAARAAGLSRDWRRLRRHVQNVLSMRLPAGWRARLQNLGARVRGATLPSPTHAKKG